MLHADPSVELRLAVAPCFGAATLEFEVTGLRPAGFAFLAPAPAGAATTSTTSTAAVLTLRGRVRLPVLVAATGPLARRRATVA